MHTLKSQWLVHSYNMLPKLVEVLEEAKRIIQIANVVDVVGLAELLEEAKEVKV